MEYGSISMEDKESILKRSALKFVVLLGVVSLFADVTYEGARSITGPYLPSWGKRNGSRHCVGVWRVDRLWSAACFRIHFKKVFGASDSQIPIFYAVAMGVDALAAILFGRLFDRVSISILIVVAILSSLFAPLVFLGNFYFALTGMALWGIGIGAQESVMKAAVAGMVPADRRGTAYGLLI